MRGNLMPETGPEMKGFFCCVVGRAHTPPSGTAKLGAIYSLAEVNAVIGELVRILRALTAASSRTRRRRAAMPCAHACLWFS
jgi:hypothetical protein